MSTKQSLKPLVYVAMSGGVDSSVAAALLKKRGFNVVGVFFKPWSPFAKASAERSNPVYFCDWQQDRQDALAAAAVLNIPFKTWDFSKKYEQKVGKYMIDGYAKGLTPNPDVMCNKEIKFGLFLKKALASGADFIATGHYVRKTVTSYRLQVTSKKNSTYNLQPTTYNLFKAKDKNKDQSYFLWTLTQKQLKHCLFPIGDHLKPEVRRLAKKIGLPNHAKKDSQGVCFIGHLDMKKFLKNYIPDKPGKIILWENKGKSAIRLLADSRGDSSRAEAPTEKLLLTAKSRGSKVGCIADFPNNSTALSKIIGTHEGAAYYTIGQRHGLNITDGGGPYFVVKKDLRRNILWVAKDENDLLSKEIKVGQVSFLDKKKLPKKLSLKVRYRTPAIPVRLVKQTNGKLYFTALQPMRAVTPGQSAVFYQGEKMLGGGVIE